MKYARDSHKNNVWAGLVVLTICAVGVHGYHVGVEDQDVYLSAAKKWLNPSLYPINAEFFTEQMKLSVFIPALAATARLVTMPWALLSWHVGSLFLLFLGCWRITELLFETSRARWAAVLLVAALLTLPIAGTALYPVDPYLHPRAPAAAGILLSIAAGLKRRWRPCAIWMTFSLLMHPLMALFGISLLFFLCFPFSNPALNSGVFAVAWLSRPSAAWNEAARARSYYFPLHWEWYEWLGLLAPLMILGWVGHLAKRRSWPMLQRVSNRLVWFGIFHTGIALLMTVPAGLTELPALQPMRWLHSFYFFFLLIVGGLIGEFALKGRPWAWLLMFGGLAGIMFAAGRITYASSDHLDLPFRVPSNQWVNAFLWVRVNTSTNDIFALDPKYMDLPQEDAYGFRAWAERSMLAEDQKDPGAVTVFPELLPKWEAEVHATRGIESFNAQQFSDLNRRFGVKWTVLPSSSEVPLSCPYRNQAAQVCRIE